MPLHERRSSIHIGFNRGRVSVQVDAEQIERVESGVGDVVEEPPGLAVKRKPSPVFAAGDGE